MIKNDGLLRLVGLRIVPVPSGISTMSVWIGKGLAYCRHIGLGLAEWQHRLALGWNIVEDGFSESSSVETLRSVPVVDLFLG